MKTISLLMLFIALLCVYVYILFGQHAYGPPGAVFKETFAVTFGTSMTADTTVVSGALATDKYFITPTLEPNGMLWAIAKAGTLIVNSTATETTLTCNIVRFR